MWLGLALTVLALSSSDAPVEGRDWLDKTEARLYAWPKPGCLVRFQVRTNLLELVVAEAEKDPKTADDPEKRRWIDAVKRASIRGTMDTGTGAVTTEIDLRFEPSNAQGKAVSEKVKSWVQSTVSRAFQGLPLHDPAMLGKKSSVLDAVERGDEVLVTVAGRSAEERNTIHLNARSLLPEWIETPAFEMRLKYSEVVPGKFAPSRLDVRMPSGQESRAEYTYQKAGELVFPSAIKVIDGPMSATLSFVSIQIEPKPR